VECGAGEDTLVRLWRLGRQGALYFHHPDAGARRMDGCRRLAWLAGASWLKAQGAGFHPADILRKLLSKKKSIMRPEGARK